MFLLTMTVVCAMTTASGLQQETTPAATPTTVTAVPTLAPAVTVSPRPSGRISDLLDYIFYYEDDDDDYSTEAYVTEDYYYDYRYYQPANGTRSRVRQQIKKHGDSQEAKKKAAAGTRKGNTGMKKEQWKQLMKCRPGKAGQCLDPSQVVPEIRCDKKRNYCRGDCDCPSYQKCCLNACGKKECLPSQQAAQVTTTTQASLPEENVVVSQAESQEAAKEQDQDANDNIIWQNN
ncbi:hypothetical protein HDE_10184 [Halotydeus destructor]|nr:hypothetical protein HDE_10184 [Halotydeus destructor]